MSTGPCTQWQTRYYFNSQRQACEPFTYGGCDGTGNRFNDQYECQTVCIAAREPTAGNAKGNISGATSGRDPSRSRWH